MALGARHDQINLIVGGLLVGLIWSSLPGWYEGLFFMGGWCFSTLFFGPDTDLGPKMRASWFGVFLYPYRLLFKHRGLSHHPVFGTLTRIVYLFTVISVVIFILNRMNVLELSAPKFWAHFFSHLVNYDYDFFVHRMFAWSVMGMFLADFSHILVDRFSSAWNAFWR